MSEGIKIFGEHDDKTVAQMWRCMGVGSTVAGVLCADGHLGYAQPVGGVIAYEDHVSISGVGFDIGCGNMAVRTDMTLSDITPAMDKIVRDIPRAVSFGLGRVNDQKVDHAVFDSPLWDAAGVGHLKEMARAQLGTVGAGNHYVDLFEDEQSFVWIGVHFGSRGLGHKTAMRFLKLAGGRDGMDVPPAIVDPKTDLGARYVAGMELAGQYAYAGREWVVDRVRRMLAAKVLDSVHNHHNFAWRERHGERDLWVVRKGATPAFPGQRGFVGGSMGDDAVIICGCDSPEGAASLYSTIHGAGRLFGRRAAKQAFTREQMDEWIKAKGVRLHGGDVDESPMAYRRLTDVLAHHAGTIEIEHTLRPFAVFMAGRGDFDPYKD
jgi:tRNA-splicing ligase RtcB (3'-phosphate/5'-hydroxy nucleic acid ligase)